MADIKQTVAKNITALRCVNHLTQSELAQKLNYSDKAVSKWERGESLPDISVLVSIAELFGVTLDYLVREVHSEQEVKKESGNLYKRVIKNHGFITGMAVLLVWVLSVITFAVLNKVFTDNRFLSLIFVYAICASLVVWLVFNSIWFNRRLNYLIISLVCWSVFFAAHVTLLFCGINFWEIYFLGILAQIIIVFWSRLKY